MNVSGLLRRFFAWWLFDSWIVAGLLFGLIMFLELLGVGASFEELTLGLLDNDFGVLADFYLIYAVLYLIYEICFVVSPLSATPGKLILGIEVVSDSKSSIVKAVLRCLVKLPAVLISPINIIYIIIGVVSSKRQSLHDKIAGTYVVYKKTNNHSSKRINSAELFEEMKRRGLRTYSEQVALAEELYGSGRKKSKKSGSYGWIGLAFLAAALIFIGIFYVQLIPVVEKIIINQYL